MTERYFPTDPDLLDEIMEASAELVENKLDEILGADRLAGIKGEQILAQNAPYRGSAGAQARKEMVRLTMSDAGARVVLHAYGVCIYEAEFAKCGGRLENVGLEVCAECPNLSVDRSHQPFWKEEIVALDLVAEELKGVDVVNTGIERQRARCAFHFVVGVSMADARRMRRERTSQQIEGAIERLRSNCCVHPKHIGLKVRVTKSAVAREAGVSIANLYRFPDLCKQIEALATVAPPVSSRSAEQRRERLVDALGEANRRIEALMTENTRLTLELGKHDQTLGLPAVIDLEERRRKSSHGRL